MTSQPSWAATMCSLKPPCTIDLFPQWLLLFRPQARIVPTALHLLAAIFKKFGILFASWCYWSLYYQISPVQLHGPWPPLHWANCSRWTLFIWLFRPLKCMRALSTCFFSSLTSLHLTSHSLHCSGFYTFTRNFRHCVRSVLFDRQTDMVRIDLPEP